MTSRSELSEEHLRAIHEISTMVPIGRDTDELLTVLLKSITELVGTDTAAVLLLDPSQRFLVARAASGIEEEVRQGVRVPVGKGFAGRIASERRPVVLDRIDSSTVENPILWDKGLKSMLGVPLESGGRLIGVLHVGTLHPRHYTEDDIQLLELVGERVTAAVQVNELEGERAAARVLQRSLLPSDLPEFEEVEFATRYVPAEEGGVGGDWYDAFRLPNGDLWVMVGDIAGHGLTSAIIMGRLRASLRSYALKSTDPAEVLSDANRKLQFFEPNKTATALYALLQPPYTSMRIASAGHLPPVLAVPDEPTRLIDLEPSPPLGVNWARPATTVEAALPEGGTFVAYTDGLIERRGESLEIGLARVRGAVRALQPELLCRELMEHLIGSMIPRDDIAVIAIRRLPARTPE